MRRTHKGEAQLDRVFGAVREAGHERYNATRARYVASPAFVERLQQGPSLTSIISNIDMLADFPSGTLGRELHEYLTAEGLDYAKFMSEYAGSKILSDDPILTAYNDRERDLHDIIHVVFRYPRTRFGEMAAIMTQYWQGGQTGYAVIVYGGLFLYLLKKPHKAFVTLRALRSAHERQKGIDLRMYPFEHSMNKRVSSIQAELGIPAKSWALAACLAEPWKD